MKVVGSVVAVLVGLPLVGGCGALGDEPDGVTVAASFYPLEYVAGRIAGGHADVEGLTSPGTEPHDVELTVRQTAVVADADVVLYAEGLQPAVDDAVAQAAEGRTVDAAQASEGLRDPDDPHFWLDPAALTAVASEVRNALGEADPEHAADYRTNFTTLSEDLERLDADFADGLADCRVDTVVVSHDAFAALEKYGLRFAPINGLSPAAEPSPAHLRELADLIETEGVTTVFTETLASPEMADTLAADLGLRTDVLDPIEGLADSTSEEDYLSLMRTNLAALREASDCR